MGKLYRPRAIYKPTGRDSWITTVWYHSRKSAQLAIKAYADNNRYSNIRIIESTKSGTCKGKHIRATSIERYYE